MNNMLMIAMAAMASNSANGTRTAHAVLGASDAIPQAGRAALGVMQEQAAQQQRVADLQAVGRELLRVMSDPDVLGKVDLSSTPFLARALELARPGITRPAAGTDATTKVALCLNTAAAEPASRREP